MTIKLGRGNNADRFGHKDLEASLKAGASYSEILKWMDKNLDKLWEGNRAGGPGGLYDLVKKNAGAESEKRKKLRAEVVKDGKLTDGEIKQLRAAGVTLDKISELRVEVKGIAEELAAEERKKLRVGAMSDGKLTSQELKTLRDAGVTPGKIKEMQETIAADARKKLRSAAMADGKLTNDEERKLIAGGVTPDKIQSMKAEMGLLPNNPLVMAPGKVYKGPSGKFDSNQLIQNNPSAGVKSKPAPKKDDDTPAYKLPGVPDDRVRGGAPIGAINGVASLYDKNPKYFKSGNSDKPASLVLADGYSFEGGKGQVLIETIPWKGAGKSGEISIYGPADGGPANKGDTPKKGEPQGPDQPLVMAPGEVYKGPSGAFDKDKIIANQGNAGGKDNNKGDDEPKLGQQYKDDIEEVLDRIGGGNDGGQGGGNAGGGGAGAGGGAGGGAGAGQGGGAGAGGGANVGGIDIELPGYEGGGGLDYEGLLGKIGELKGDFETALKGIMEDNADDVSMGDFNAALQGILDGNADTLKSIGEDNDATITELTTAYQTGLTKLATQWQKSLDDRDAAFATEQAEARVRDALAREQRQVEQRIARDNSTRASETPEFLLGAGGIRGKFMGGISGFKRRGNQINPSAAQGLAIANRKPNKNVLNP